MVCYSFCFGQSDSTLIGVYVSKSNNVIILKDSSQFRYEIKGIEWPKHCMGKWEEIGDDKLYIECIECDDPSYQLSSGYMEPIKGECTILNNGNLKYGGQKYKKDSL